MQGSAYYYRIVFGPGCVLKRKCYIIKCLLNVSVSVFKTPTYCHILYPCSNCLLGISTRLSGRHFKCKVCKTKLIIYPNRLVPFPVFLVLVSGSTLTKVYQA